MAVGPSFAADGKSTVAVTHLASARSQNSGNGTLGIFYGAFRGSFFCAELISENEAMDRRMIILWLLLGVLCFTITLSEDTMRTTEVFQDKSDAEEAVAAVERQNADPADTSQREVKSVIGTVTDPPTIRVVLSKDHSGQILADTLTVSWSQEAAVGKEKCPAGSRSFGSSDIPEEGLCLQTGGYFTISYDGSPDERQFTETLYLYAKERLVYAVNAVSLENYTACVVPGEMPAYYPEEALKAQAVCARTYALRHKNSEEKYHADLGDTVSWQVFNSVGRTEKTDEAVAKTVGKVIFTGNDPAELYFYSTSCGFSGTDDVWNTSQVSPCLKAIYVGDGEKSLGSEAEFSAYITGGDDTAWEKDQAWFRWHASFSETQLLELCKRQGDTVTEITDIRVTKRSSGYAATELTLNCGEKKLVISEEYNIREFFSPYGTALSNQEGTLTDRKVLPSGYFILDTVKEGGKVTAITLYGGGFGHGAGMSQNAARCMAEHGMSCEKILRTFFDIS